MKTILSKLVLLAVLITASVNLQSCSDDSGEEPNVPNLEMVCTSCSSNDSYISGDFNNAIYDGLRIISYSDFHENLIEYKYFDNKIEQYKNNELEATHTLNNGVIVESEEEDCDYHDFNITKYIYKNNRIIQI